MGLLMEDDNGFDYEELEIARFLSNKMFDKLMDMKDDDFLDYILKNGADSDYVLENFKPWSITNKIKTNGWKPTYKQKKAISNVYCYWEYGIKPYYFEGGK